MRNLRIVLNRWLSSLGVTGIVAIGLLIFCASFYASWIQPRHERVRTLEAKSTRLQKSAPARTPAVDGKGPLDDFYAFFPSTDAIPKALQSLFLTAQRQGLDIAKSEYRLVGSADPNMTTYQVRFPLTGSYGQIRKFLAAALQQFPFASLDELRLEKKRVEDPRVDTQIRFTFYLHAK